MNIIKQWLTERDNATFCLVRALLSSGGITMIYTFITAHGTDYMGLGGGLAAIGSAVAVKNLTEK